ncbi:MAG: M20/M25/M40 family metallo-hydrolase [Gemmatimonadota bacterium]
MSTWPTEIELLRALVATPSISGDETQVAELVEHQAGAWGLPVVRDHTGVKILIEGASSGETLALVSHLDVVPPGTGWTRDPFEPHMEDGKLFGRGSGDAKASVAAMLTAALDIAADVSRIHGRLVVILGYSEETRNTSMPFAISTVGAIDAAVIGEPTNLDFAIAQRGLMMIDLVARGDQRHAAYAAEGTNAPNAVELLAADLTRLKDIARHRPHPLLGHPSIAPTMLESGVSRNVIPSLAKAVLDVRSTPAWSHEELAGELREHLSSEVVVTSDRLVPCQTPEGSRLLAAASRIRPHGRHYGSPTCSDWVFLRDRDAFKCGPGTSRRSHTADEFVDLAEVTEARVFYRELALSYLGVTRARDA